MTRHPILGALLAPLAISALAGCASAGRSLEQEVAGWRARAQTLERRQAAERGRLIAELREIADRHAVEGTTRRVPNDEDCGEVGSVYSEDGGEQCVVTHKTPQGCDIFCVPIVEPEDPSPADPNP